MNKKEFITLGFPIISKEVFRNILRPLNNFGFKPTGGFWASKPCFNICEWYDYLDRETCLSEYKDKQNGVIFTLKEDAKILTISSEEDIIKLAQKYPSYHHLLNYYEEYPNRYELTFNFEELEKEYDAIYVDYDKLYGRYSTNKNTTFDTWSISTLLLLNLDCISKYRTIKVKEQVVYTGRKFSMLEEEKEEKKVEPISSYYVELYNLTEAMFLEKLASNKTILNTYDEYLTLLVQTANECINLMQDNHLISNIEDIIKEDNHKIKREIIIRNIVLNILSHYLRENKESIKKLEKSKHTKRKWYEI